MNQVLDFIFNSFGVMWGLITSSWLVAFPVLLGVLALVIDLINGSKQS